VILEGSDSIFSDSNSYFRDYDYKFSDSNSLKPSREIPKLNNNNTLKGNIKFLVLKVIRECNIKILYKISIKVI
jgi:hypothetical protein